MAGSPESKRVVSGPKLRSRPRSGGFRGPRKPAVALALAFSLGAAACGSELGPGSLGAEPTTTTARPTTTTEPPPTTSTIDFDRPVTQKLSPLPEDPTVADVEAILSDIRGQTTDVSGQMGRLALFVDIATLVPAQILGFEITIGPADEDALHEQVVTVLQRNGATLDETTLFLEQQLRGAGWNRATAEQEVVDQITSEIETFRVPGEPASEVELTIRTSDGPEATRIEIHHFSMSADHADAWDALSSWHPDLPLPSGATRSAVTVRTGNDLASAVVSYEVSSESAAETRADLVSLIGRSTAYELVPGTDVEDEESDEPLALIDAEGAAVRIEFATVPEPETVGINVMVEFPLDPIDP